MLCLLSLSILSPLWQILGQKLEGKTQEKDMHMGMGTMKGQKRDLEMLLPPLGASASPQHGVAQVDLSWKTLPQISGLPATLCGDGLGIT